MPSRKPTQNLKKPTQRIVHSKQEWKKINPFLTDEEIQKQVDNPQMKAPEEILEENHDVME